jgi:hypothetical protein
MKQIIKKFKLAPPLIYNILILIFLCSGETTFAQVKNDVKFRRYREFNRPETFRINHVEYRKLDNVVVGIYGVQEYVQGFTPEE